jgi:drug/metabolite transporter (DMT)-like permease
VIDPISITLYRFLIALVILSVIFIKKEYRQKFSATFWRGLLISLFYSLYFIGMFKALETTTVLNTSTLYTLVPLITAILCIFFFKEKISAKELLVYFIAMAGTAIVVFKADISLFLSFSLNSGDVLFLLGSISMAFYSIFLKILYRKDDKLLVLVFSTLLGGCIWMFLAMQILDIPLEWEKIEGELFYYVLYLAVATTIMTLFLYQKSATVLSSKKLMAYVYLSPAIVAIISYFWVDAVITWGIFFGIVVSVFATIVLLREKT